MPGPIEFDVRADASQARRELGTVDGSFARLGQSARRHGAAAARGLGVVAAASAALAVTLAKGAAEDQRSAVQLETALRNRTDATGRDVAAVERWITAQGRARGVADDELRPAIAQLATATGDVGKAQRLTALAMDIAAGRGVKLSTVTKALERAQNGSTAGLSRLGVKTKDAAGETKSLEAITRELSATYRGQAARSANTAAGQYDRLRIFITETGEAIGYTLLPQADRFARFIQSRGVPTVESYWRAFERGGADNVVRQLDRQFDAGGRVVDVYDELEGSASAVVRIVRELGGAFVGVAEDTPALLSPLKLLDDVLGGIATVLENTPDRLLEFGVAAGIAAAVVPRLQAGVAATSGAMVTGARSAATYYAVLRGGAATTTAAAAAQARLAAAARTTAGVAGMVALTTSASTANEELQLLANVGGGALLGFSVGGPVGAAIGGAAGGLLTLSQRTQDAADKAHTAAVGYDELRGSLDQTTGAITRQTRATVVESLAKSGLLEQASRLGISQRDLVNGILGESNARRDLRARVVELTQEAERLERLQIAELNRPDGSRKRQAAYGREAARLRDVVEAIEDSIGAEDRARTSTAERLALINRIPKRLQVELQTNAPKTIRDFARLAAVQNLTRRQIRAAIRLTGSDLTVRQIREVQRRLEETGRVRPDFAPFNAGLGREIGNAKRRAGADVLSMNRDLGRVGRARMAPQFLGSVEQGLRRGRSTTQSGVGTMNELLTGAGRSRADMGPFVDSLADGIRRGRGEASQAYGVGQSIASGAASGVRSRASAVADEAAGMVARAIMQAKLAARSASPSRETFDKVGVPLADGVTAGIKAGTPAARRQAKSLVALVIADAQEGATGAIRDRITKLVEQRVQLKDDKAERRREAAVIRGLREQFRLLELNARAQTRVNRLLDAARDKHKQLVAASRQYAASTKEIVVGFGSVVGLGAVTEGAPDGTVSLALMLDELRDRAAKAERFNQLLSQLAEDGLSRTAVDQIREAGPAALGTLEAIASGGDAALNEVNRLTASIARSGSQLGATLATEYHAAGIQAAAGVVRGLEAQSRQLDRAASRLARALVRAVRRELGIQSPSTVFKALGGETVRGLELGLDDTRARSAGARLAVGVKAGYGRPQLTTTLSGAGADVQTIRLVLTGEVQSQLTAGKSVTVDVDVARAAGVRKLAVGGVR